MLVLNLASEIFSSLEDLPWAILQLFRPYLKIFYLQQETQETSVASKLIVLSSD